MSNPFKWVSKLTEREANDEKFIVIDVRSVGHFQAPSHGEKPQILLTQAKIMMPSKSTFAAALLLGLAPLTLGSTGVHHSVMDIIENNKDARWFVAEKGNP